MKFNDILKILKENKKSYYSTVVFPVLPPDPDDIYIYTENGDRLDKIAYEFYKDYSAWKIIADINNIPNDSLFPEVGIQLRIPQTLDKYYEEYEKINLNR